jgi:hypothetical protein
MDLQFSTRSQPFEELFFAKLGHFGFQNPMVFFENIKSTFIPRSCAA